MAPFLAYTCTVFQNNIAFTCSSFAVIIAVSNVKIDFWKHLPTMKQWHYQFLATAKLKIKLTRPVCIQVSSSVSTLPIT